MAATKASKTTGWSSTAQAAGTGPTTGTAIDLTTAYGANITVQVVTTTAPTSAGTVFISTSVDNTTWVTWATGTVGLAASTTYNYGWELPPSMAYVRVDITSGTGTGVTVSAQCEALTGL